MAYEVTGRGVRGCGSRDAGAAYLCCGLSVSGLRVEAFVVDPVILWPGNFQRGVKIMPRGKGSPINDALIFVGKQFYRSVWDFVEEVRILGVSRKISPTFPFEKLTPGESRMIFIHSRAWPRFRYRLDRNVPLFLCKRDSRKESGMTPGYHLNGEPCAMALRDLAYYTSKVSIFDGKLTDRTEFRVTYPSFSYRGVVPAHPLLADAPTADKDQQNFLPGIFMAVPITHVEWKDRSDPKVEKRAQQAGFESVVLDH